MKKHHYMGCKVGLSFIIVVAFMVISHVLVGRGFYSLMWVQRISLAVNLCRLL